MQRGLVDLLGPFVEPPDERDTAWRSPHGYAVRAPELQLEVGHRLGLSPRPTRVCETLACSVVAHTGAVIAVIAVPLLLSVAIPQPAGTVKAFFVEPMSVPPPPPPPPPAARAAAPRAAAPRPQDLSDNFVAPVETPSELEPEEWLDLGDELGLGGGAPGGVAGGVPGGVVGALIPLPEKATEPPKPVQMRAGVHVKRPVKVKHVPPVYPDVAAKARVHGVVILEAVIDREGRVASATILRGMPLLSEAALAAVRQWEYTPTLLNGVPIAVVMTITVRFELVNTAEGGASG